MHTSRFFLFWYTSHLNKYSGGWVLGRQCCNKHCTTCLVKTTGQKTYIPMEYTSFMFLFGC